MKKCRLFQDAPCIILGTDLSSDLRAQNFNGLVVIRSANSSAEDFENYMRNGDVDVCIGNEEDAELCLGFKPDADVEGGHTDAEGYKEIFIQMAKEFDSPSKFKERYSSAYNAAKRNGWLDDVTKHMANKKIKWTDDMIMSQLSNYDSVGDLRNSNPKLFAVAFRRLGNDFLKKYYNDIHNNLVFQTVK
jgi:hypothetical protein